MIIAAAIAGVIVGMSSVHAQKGQKPSDLPVHTYFLDNDATGNPYTIQSDGLGAYVNGGGVVSILNANGYNGITWGDWRLDLVANSSSRTVGISFCDGTTCALNAVQPGDPGYTAPANPPWWGTQWEPALMWTKCSFDNHDMHAMKPGDSFQCIAAVHIQTASNVEHNLAMGTSDPTGNPLPETQEPLVKCNSADSNGCNDWSIYPVPVMNADGTTSPGHTRARLTKVVTGNGGKVLSKTNEGDFYLTFLFHVTRP
jgi:hypothetical protein